MTACYMLRMDYRLVYNIMQKKHIIYNTERTGRYIINNINGTLESGWEIKAYKKEYDLLSKVYDARGGAAGVFSDVSTFYQEIVGGIPENPTVINVDDTPDKPRILY